MVCHWGPPIISYDIYNNRFYGLYHTTMASSFLLDKCWGAGQQKTEKETRKATLLLPCAMHLVITGRDPTVLASKGSGVGGGARRKKRFFSRPPPGWLP